MQRSITVTRDDRCPGPGSLTWGWGGGRNCMACKGSGVQIPSAPPQVKGLSAVDHPRIPAPAQQIRSNSGATRCPHAIPPDHLCVLRSDAILDVPGVVVTPLDDPINRSEAMLEATAHAAEHPLDGLTTEVLQLLKRGPLPGSLNQVVGRAAYARARPCNGPAHQGCCRLLAAPMLTDHPSWCVAGSG